MFKLLMTGLLTSPAVLWMVFGAASAVSANTLSSVTEVQAKSQLTELPVAEVPTNLVSLEQVQAYEGVDSDPASQVTSVSQLSDVQPTDWAFQALQSLVERYGCIAGYPDGTYRGNRALTRYEFAAGMNACLDRVNELIAAGTADLVTKEDLAVLQRLQEEFAAELATLRGRVDALEARTAELEANQFSTTTKLTGEAIFNIADAFGGIQGDNANTILTDRVRLNFLTSFTGSDLLTTRLQMSNASRLLSNNSISATTTNYFRTNEGNFTFDGGDTSNNVLLDRLDYRFPIGRALNVTVFAANGQHHYYADTVNPYLEGNGGGSNAISRFAERNPIYRIGSLGSGVGLSFRPSSNLRVDLGYLANTGNNPTSGSGLFNGNYSALAQLVVDLGRAKFGFTYVNGYERNDPTITANANNNLNLFGTGTTFANLNRLSLLNGRSVAVASNSYGLEASLTVTPNFLINAWGGLTNARMIGLGDAEIWNFAVGLAFPDLGKKGNLGGIIVGAEPTLRGLNVPAGTTSPAFNGARDFAYHVEGFYKLKLTDNISVTPGVIYLPSVNQNASTGSDNADVFIGTLRTTFTF